MTNFIHSVLGFSKLSPAQKIASSFVLVILIGTILLMLPISNNGGAFFNPIHALFQATSATCVTGLSLVSLSVQFNWFGQLIVLLLIQIGGLGLMTFMAMFILIVKNRLSMHEKIAMKEMLNHDRVGNMRKFLLDILYYTLFFEAIGAILISFRMIPRYGLLDGGFKAIFLAVSAFCNAGFDTLGSVSLQNYVHDPLIMLTIMTLIILGGLGFAVWFDIRDKIGPLIRKEIKLRKFRHSLSLHTKIVVAVSAFLIIIPSILILIVEFNNPQTIGDFNIFEKVLAVIFESVALRTAGFSSIDYGALNPATGLLMMVVMFIGGSPGGTAGGIKTTTITVLIIYVISTLRGREQTVLLKRNIGRSVIVRAMGLFFINLVVLFTGIYLLNVLEDKDFLSLSFEAVSAMATVGASRGITGSLGTMAKLVIIFLMFVGRIGILTFIISITRSKPNKNAANKVSYPDGNIIVG